MKHSTHKLPFALLTASFLYTSCNLDELGIGKKTKTVIQDVEISAIDVQEETESDVQITRSRELAPPKG